MKAEITLTHFSKVFDLPDYWTLDDYRALLEAFEFPDADQVSKPELEDMLKMAITDFSPEDAAEVLLKYKLLGKLTEGQIQQVAHTMLSEPMAEEYPDISLHYDFFQINRLLYKAYNGKFPNIKATIMECTIRLKEEVVMTKELLLRLLAPGLSERNVIKRLYEDELAGKVPFKAAKDIIWDWSFNAQSGECQIITSDYWMSQEDFDYKDFEAEVD